MKLFNQTIYISYTQHDEPELNTIPSESGITGAISFSYSVNCIRRVVFNKETMVDKQDINNKHVT